MTKKTNSGKIGRDAKTGEFRTVEYARKHPNTTVVETRQEAFTQEEVLTKASLPISGADPLRERGITHSPNRSPNPLPACECE